MINFFKYSFIVSFIYCSCPQIIDSQILYEDSCGDCWLPYCYNSMTHEITYDTTEELCNVINSSNVVLVHKDKNNSVA